MSKLGTVTIDRLFSYKKVLCSVGIGMPFSRKAMKRIIETTTVLAATVLVAHAQLADFRLAYGDATTAALNGANVGDLIPDRKVITISPTGGEATFSIGVIARSEFFASTGGIFVGVDQALSRNGAGFRTLDGLYEAGQKKLVRVTSTFTNFADIQVFDRYEGSFSNMPLRALGPTSFIAAFQRLPFATERAIGISQRYGVNDFSRFSIALNPGEFYSIANFTIRNEKLESGEVFGDEPGENGLTLNRESFSPQGGNFLSPGGVSGKTVKYGLRAENGLSGPEFLPDTSGGTRRP